MRGPHVPPHPNGHFPGFNTFRRNVLRAIVRWVLPVALVVTVIIPLSDPTIQSLSVRALFVATGIAAIGAVYVIAHLPPLRASRLLVSIALIAVTTVSFGTESNLSGIDATRLLLPVLLAGLLLPTREVLIVALLTAGSNLAGALLIVNNGVAEPFIEGLMYNGLFVALLMMATHHRDRLEQQHIREMQISHQRLQAVVEDQGDLIFRVNVDDLRVTYANSAFATYVEREPADVTGQLITDLLPEDICAQIRRVAESLTPTQFTAAVTVQDSRGRWFHWQTRAVFDGEQAIEYQCVGRNISEVLAAEARMRESEATARALLSAPVNAVALVAPDGVLLDVNPSLARRFGSTCENMIGTDIWKMLPEDTRDEWRTLFDGVVASARMERFDAEWNGTWHDTLLHPITDDRGQVVRVAAISHDITDRRMVEEALRLSQARYRTLIEAAPVGIFQTDIEGNVLFVNRYWCQIAGYEMAQLFGQNWTSVVHPNDVSRLLDMHTPVSASDEPVGIECRIVRADGSTRQVAVQVTGLTDGFLGTMVDVEDRKRAEQQAFALTLERERVQLLAQFVRSVSHEFRTPLSVIKSAAYVLEHDVDAALRDRKLAQMHFQVARMTRLVDSLLLLTRLDTTPALKLATVDVAAMLTALVSRYTSETNGHRLTVQTELPAHLPPVQADHELLEHALRELLHNALRYTQPGGAVTVAARTVRNGIEARFEDNGPGIAPEDCERLFERFFRLDTAHSTPGLGLGLSIARRVIELHAGSLAVKSCPGAGSIFTVWLPYAN